MNVVKLNVRINGRPNSVTVRKDLFSLWLVMHNYRGNDPVGLLQGFVDEQCLPRWHKKYARGLGEFINICL